MRSPKSGNGSHPPLRALYGRHRKHVPFRRFYNFCRNILYKQRVDQDLDQEIRSYLDLLAEEKARSGMGRDEALQQARRELGGVEQIKENVRDVRVGVSMDNLLQDVRYGLRCSGGIPASQPPLF